MELIKVFGISTNVNQSSYIDRANLDERFKKLLKRDTHIALKGASKSGKSWLRQKCILNANVVQCRLNKSIQNIYVEALSNLGVKLELESTTSHEIKGTVEGSNELGNKILGKVAAKIGLKVNTETSVKEHNLKYDLTNLKNIADIIIASKRRLVIEDFHYLSMENRSQFAYDLKALWDYGCYVIIIGVWTRSNLLTYLNPDLTGRINELSIIWSDEDLRGVIEKGCTSLNVCIDEHIINEAVSDSFGNVGILQTIIYNLLDNDNIEKTCRLTMKIDDVSLYHEAAKIYADQLDGVYQRFVEVLSKGIRKRHDSTGIYTYTMRAIIEADDETLQNGFPREKIFEITHNWEPRIQIANLKTILKKLEDLQIDNDRRGLVIGYDESTDAIFVVDRQLLFYKKYRNIKWPWEELLSGQNEIED